ncbi:Polynucleotide 3'-phosphatase ZDP [Dictyocoela muelleri]|nr:Polynucleotide 3'-phosphatase ZDP [Dictyocoela muelleri]
MNDNQHLLIVKNVNFFPTTSKIAFFDFDSTLVKKCTNNSSSPYVFAFKTVFRKINELYSCGYTIAILSNQSRIDDPYKFKSDIMTVLKKFKIPIIFIAATNFDYYRKPSIGMYEFFVNVYLNGNIPVSSFYVGDAAGRISTSDHSDCDIKFAYNAGLKFYTPEQFFNGSQEIIDFEKFNATYFSGTFHVQFSEIVFVFGKGFNSGRNFFVQKYFPNHKIINEKQINEFINEKLINDGIDGNIVFIDCYKRDLIMNFLVKRNCTIYFLDYPDNVLKFLNNLEKLTGNKPKYDKCIFDHKFIKELSDNVINVPFIFDNTEFDPIKKKISLMQL